MLSRVAGWWIAGFLAFFPANAGSAAANESPRETGEEGRGVEASATEEPADSDGRDRGGFGGPDQVDQQITQDDESRGSLVERTLYDPYFDWKKGLQEKYGLSFGFDYSAALLASSDSPDGAEDRSASGMVRFFGSWDLVGRGTGNTGAIVWKVEHRHSFTDVSPKDFGFNLGYVGLFEPSFSDQHLRWTNLYWRQRFAEGRGTLLAGFLDPTDYLDVYALASPWTGFLNFAFSTGSATIPVPNDAALGLAGAAMLTENFFVIGGLTDRNADPTDPFDGFETFFEDHEYFRSIEVGWTPSHDRLYLDNAHVAFWHADERSEAGEPSGWGLNGSFSRYLDGGWLPFVRGGYAKDGGSLLQKSLSVGCGYQPVPAGSLLGVGLNWGEPNEDTFGSGLRDQYTAEVFYRWQVTPRFAVTPDLQLLENPALDPDEDRIWVVGLRLRMAL
jgi:porin